MRYTLALIALVSLTQSAPFLDPQSGQSIPATDQAVEFISHTLYVKDHGHFAPSLVSDPSGSSALSAAHSLSDAIPDQAEEDELSVPSDMTLDEMKERLHKSPFMDVAPYVFFSLFTGLKHALIHMHCAV